MDLETLTFVKTATHYSGYQENLATNKRIFIANDATRHMIIILILIIITLI